jgi:predicted nucleotidyltransferase
MGNDNMNVVDRIRSGWGRFFSRENGRATETKYIPQSRFFFPSELEELEKKDELNPIEKRALEYGKIAAKQSNRSNIEYVPVLFDGTTLVAWVDGEESPLADFRAKMMNDELKREGYQLSKELEQSILKEQGKALVDKLFIRKGEEYIKVDSYSGDNEPSLSFTSYNIETMESVNIPYDVRLFQEMLGREEMKEAETYNILDFDKKLQTLRESQNLLQDTVKFIEESKIYKGKLDISEGHEYSSLGDYSSHSWSYGAGNIEFYGYFEDDGDAIQTKVINTKSAYHYRELLREVSDAVQREKVLNDVNAMRQALGKEPIQGEHQITYLTTQKDNLLKELLEAMDATSLAAQGPLNTELEHRQDEAAFLKLNKALNAVTGSYDKSEKVLEDYEKSNGIHDTDISNMAKRMNSVSKYIDTLKDTRIPMSGDFQEHLPNNHHLRELYSKFESSEEELYGYSRSVGAEEGEYERLKVNYKNASDAFNKELTDILDYYENLMNLNGETIHENIQGLEYYGKRSLKNHILDEITEKFVIGFEGDEITRVNDLEIHGSRGRGTARPDSDLDVVVEYEGSLREDDAFNFLNEDPLIYNGIKVDVNPIRKQETGTLQDYMVKSRKYDQKILKQLGEDNANKAEAEKKIRFSRVSTDIESLDTEYINAVKSGDMKKAQQMVNAAAAIAGYNSSSSYQGTSAFNGAAPYGNGYFNSPEERKKAWDADPEHLEYEGDQTLGDYIKNGIDVNSLSFIALDPRNLRAADNYRREAIENIRQAIQSKSDTITMYRSVPSDVKEGSFRNGDWVTPSYSYAVDNASVHGWGDNYRIIEQKVSVDEIWWDGNDIAEWGYGNEQDYVQDKDYAYKNTKNNRKSLDAVTYDNDGNIIPLSKRFNDALADVRYQRSGQTVSPAKVEVELRDTLIGKLRSAGIDVITDVDEGQRVLDSFNKDARHQAVYHGKSSVKTGYNPRNYITPVRGEWTKEKIIKRLKESGGSLAGYSRAAELISEFDSPKELSEHMFYHGTYYGRGRLKPSMIMSDREVERIGGGGYGDKYWGISVSKSKEIASRFSGIHEGVFIYPIVLAKNANVKEMPDLNDAADLDDCIIDLWKEGIDAVWIGDKNRGEQELCVINPKAIVNIDSSDYYKAFMLGSEKNPLRIIDKAGIEKLYADAKTFVKQKQVAPRKPSSPSHFVLDESGRFAEDKDGHLILKSKEKYQEERKVYEQKISDYESSQELADWKQVQYDASRNIRFFKDKEGTSYGFTVNDKIYVDPRIATAETPIHEYSHLWATAIQKVNPKEWENIVGLMKNTSIWNEVKASYKDLHTDNEIADEVLATYSGRAGAEKLRKMVSDSNGEGVSAIKKATIKRDVFFLESALKKFWQAMASFLGIHYESAEQVADQVLKDMLNEVNPAKKLKEFTESRDDLYQEYVENGNMEKAFELVMEEASMKLAENPMPEVTDAYSVSHEQEPEATIKVYKVFTLDKDGDPSALFVSGKDKLPMGVWLNAQDTWHFTAANGKDYVPSTRNPNGRGGKTGSSVLIPNDQVRKELIQRGFLPDGSKAKYITALAYRPGWHAADLPYFPQGGKQDPESNYGNVHRSNQVVFECEFSANRDYTETARSQTKAYNGEGKFVARNADLQYMPKDGYYQYTTNQFLKDEDKGHWYIGGAMKINRALTQEECDTILKENGKAVQEWENDILDLKKLNYATISSKVKPVLAPVMYDETGKMIPLSRRFEDSRTTINEPRRMFIGTIGAANVDTASKSVNLSSRLDLLSLAKQMNTAGSSAKDIKQITGWEIGADNNWKYETEDVKRFDWNGNILYEKNHPDFKRYMELVNKDNEHIFCEGEALRPSEVEEYDRLAEEYGGLDGKLDNHTMLDAYIDAPDVFEAYPELRNVKVEFEALKGNEKACFTSAHNYLDRLFDVDESLKFGGTITINTNKLNRFQDEKDIRGIIGHEIQHAVQEIEGFARGGAPQTIRKEIQENVACHQAEKDFIVSNLKQWAVLTDMANRLEASRKELQRDGKVWQEIGRRHYWDAMNEIDTNPNEKYKLENEYEKVFGKDFDDLEVAKSGYHVKEAAIELRRQAQVCKDGLTTSDKITLKQMTIMEESLKNNSDNQIYWKLAGEVEARNTSKRVGMTPLQRRNTLASETEDVDRKEQIVIKESPQRNYVTLSSPSTGRWHTADNEQREACEGYAELISKAIKCNLVWNDDSIGKAYNLNGQPFDIGDSYILSLHCNKNGYNTPIFATEQEVRQLNIGVWEKTMPFSLIKNGEVKKLYNIEDLSSFPQRFEIIKQIEDRETMKKAKANALSVFPTWKYPELDMTVKKEVQLDYNERRDLAKNLLDYSRGKMPDSYEAKSKETLVRCVAMGMLGNLYEFQYSEKVPGSNGLIARLERDPAFSKEILDKASASVAKVCTFVEENVRSFGEDKKLDLRSLTPIDMDVDGNGIVESQENLAADKKQGEDEPGSQSQDTSHKHKGRVV